MLPVILGVGAAFCFGVQIALTGATIRCEQTSIQLILWVQTTFVLLTALVWFAVLGPAGLSIQAVTVLLAGGILAPLIARTLFVKSIARLGSNITTPIVLSHPLITVLLASALLHEKLGGVGWGGVVVTLLGGLMVATRPKIVSQISPEQAISPAFLGLAVVSAVASGTSLFLRKLGLNMGVGAALAALITSIPAWIVYSGWLVARRPNTFGMLQNLSSMTLLGSGVAGSIGMVLWYTGINVSPLSKFAPLGALVPIFALLINFLFYRVQETFSVRVVCGTLLSVIGVGLIAYNSTS